MCNVGTQPFGVLNLLVRAPVLIPRPETEHWTMRLAQFIRPTPTKPVNLLDLCTGSGCIPLLLCRLWPPGSVRATGVDISKDAIQLSYDNARVSEVHVPSDNLPSPPTEPPIPAQNTFLPLLANIRDPAFARHPGLVSPFDVITSNPPYISREEYDNLPTSVRDFEDARALLGDPDPGHEQGCGLTFYHEIAQLVARDGFLSDNGILAVEVGQGQAKSVERILLDANMKATAIWKDPWEIERVVVASKDPARLS